MDWTNLPESIRENVRNWLTEEVDEQTRARVQWLAEHDREELMEAFSTDLEFGTGGLRGIMGVGPNRMNIYTVRRATLGVARYVQESYPHTQELRAAIAYDSRNNSKLFAEETASTFARVGFRVYLYEDVRPTPQLSFTVRALHCHAGVVVTASHNPKEYNGYKVYWADGGQVVAPHDKRIIACVRDPETPDRVSARAEGAIVRLKAELDEAYLSTLLSSIHHPESIARRREMGIAYTPIHGTGGAIVPQLLHRMGFGRVHVVEQQKTPNGDFPTVPSPNPEDPRAMALAVEMAQQLGCSLVLGTDPDGDRMGAYARNGAGTLVRLNGNQLAVLLAEYHLSNSEIAESPYIVRTIVTTPLLDAVAAHHGATCRSVLTGFKYIAEIMEGDPSGFVFGCEESHGYLSGLSMRDKDGMQACGVLAEMCAWAEDRGKSMIDLLEEIYQRHGFRYEGQLSLVREGLQGQQEIATRMQTLRQAPPSAIEGEAVVVVRDYLDGTLLQPDDAGAWTRTKMDSTLPSSDVLQLETAEGSIITVRPSGTEPKIKYYVSIRSEYCGWDESLQKQTARAQRILNALAN